MRDNIIWNEKVYINGEELLKLIETVASEELPVDAMWAAGLMYSKRLVRVMMGLEQEEHA